MAGDGSNTLRAVLKELGWSRTRLVAELRRQAARWLRDRRILAVNQQPATGRAQPGAMQPAAATATPAGRRSTAAA